MKQEINEAYHGDVRELCKDLTSDEKREIVEEIIHRHDIDMDDIYESLSSSQKESLKGEFPNEEKQNRYDELYYNEKDPLNDALVNLFDKSHMLTKKEEMKIIKISEQYKHF